MLNYLYAFNAAVLKYDFSWGVRRQRKRTSNMNNSELSAVFDFCQPNPQGLISLEKLGQLFDNHNAGVQV